MGRLKNLEWKSWGYLKDDLSVIAAAGPFGHYYILHDQDNNRFLPGFLFGCSDTDNIKWLTPAVVSIDTAKTVLFMHWQDTISRLFKNVGLRNECNCGGLDFTHEVGRSGCLRIVVTDPAMIPANRRTENVPSNDGPISTIIGILVMGGLLSIH